MPLAFQKRLNVHVSGPAPGCLGKGWENDVDWHGRHLANPVDTGLYYHSDARIDVRSGDRYDTDWPHSELDAGKAAGSAAEQV